MATITYRSYEEAAQDYVARFRALREAPPAPAEAVTRGAGEIAAETLIEQADQIAEFLNFTIGVGEVIRENLAV